MNRIQGFHIISQPGNIILMNSSVHIKAVQKQLEIYLPTESSGFL